MLDQKTKETKDLPRGEQDKLMYLRSVLYTTKSPRPLRFLIATEDNGTTRWPHVDLVFRNKMVHHGIVTVKHGKKGSRTWHVFCLNDRRLARNMAI